MHPSFFPTSSLFFAIIVIISTLIHVPTYLCVDDVQYVTCGEPFQCANIENIGYPFWGQNRPENCGHPDFQLQNCQGDAPLISFQSNPYRVLTINNTKQTVTVAREDLWNNLCPTNLYDTPLKYSHFIYTPNQTILILNYGCFAGPQQPPQQFNCSLNGSSTNSVNYFIIANNGSGGLPLRCNGAIIVVVNETSGQALAKSSASTSDLIAALNGGFGLRWFANNSICNECVKSGGRCGSNSTSNSFACYCADRPYSLACDNVSLPGSTKGLNTKMKLISVLLSTLGFISMIFVTIWCLEKRGLSVKAMVFCKKGSMNDQKVEELIRDHRYPIPKRYSYADIKNMTNSFKDKLGQGGYGDVYKGKLSDGFLVAVKVLNEAKGEGDEFINEVASISRTSHVNIVALLGFCFEGSKRALIYEFMPNKSLDKFICNDSHRLDWNSLFQIAVGVAQGLEYLHRGCNTRIVHFDIKPHNILLDEDFRPKISDFGLAKLCKKKESIVSMLCARGTPGYIAPEVFCKNFGGVSNKSDVYSYGMMVLEMVGARENTEVGEARTSEIYFPDWIYEHLEHGNDLRHYGVTTEEEEEIARKMILTSLWCIQTNPSDRPSMSKVVDMWEGSLESLQIPPKPSVFSPMRLAEDPSASLSQSCETIVELPKSVHQ